MQLWQELLWLFGAAPVLALIAWIDARRRVIPNVLNLLLAAIGIGFAWTSRGSLVEFFWAARPDVISYGTGLGIARATKRMTAVRVSHGGAVQKAYVLTYGQNSVSGLSRLTRVSPYGSDVVLDAAGTVTAGSALPSHIQLHDGCQELQP